jgi:hypothetical protein
MTEGTRLARRLGWFSIVLGATEVFAPRVLSRVLGLPDGERAIRAYGVREMLTGAGILASANPTPWIWARVAGDALDLGSLAKADGQGDRRSVRLAMAAVAGVTALDIACARGLQEEDERPVRDYSRRSGMPMPAEQMRGAARDFVVPADMRAPEALRPYVSGAHGPRSV